MNGAPLAHHGLMVTQCQPAPRGACLRARAWGLVQYATRTFSAAVGARRLPEIVPGIMRDVLGPHAPMSLDR
jgi:hypothetical protein